MEESIEKLIIHNEDEAFELLKQALSNKVSDTAQVTFEGWPVFNLTIEGKDFNGSIPTRIMPPILELQKEIHRIYCRARYKTENTNRLTSEERELLELIVTIKPGSTKFITDLFNALNEIVKNSNMNGTEVLTLLIVISVLLASIVGWKDWLSSQERKHGQDATVRHSEQETERLKLITEAIVKIPEIKQNRKAIEDLQSDLARKLKPTDQIKINEVPIISGDRAEEIVREPKQSSKSVRLDGDYAINDVKFPEKYGEAYRFSVTRLSDDKTFMLDVSPEMLSEEQIGILKDSAFGIKHVTLGINARENRGHISDAHAVSIEWPKSESFKNPNK